MSYFLEKDWMNLKIVGCDTSVNTDGTLPHPLREPKRYHILTDTHKREVSIYISNKRSA